jgi:hypothetical protein
MSYITGVDRNQTMLLPETLEDYIAAFIDGLNLSQCGFGRTQPAATGRPPFAPGDLLKLYLWLCYRTTPFCGGVFAQSQEFGNEGIVTLSFRISPTFLFMVDV